MTTDGPLSVALLSPCYWPEVRRGTERFARDLADGLLKRGQRPTLITSHPGLPSRSIEDDLPVLRLPRPPQGRLLRRGYEPYLTHLPLSYVALRAGSYDVAHALYPADALAAARWRAKTAGPSVFSYMGIPDRRGLVEYRSRLAVMQKAVAGADAVVALSRHAAVAFERWLGVEARVIEPGVDLETFKPAAGRSPVPTIVCSAAADVPRKHVRLVIEAFAHVRQVHPDARLVLSQPGNPAAAHRSGVPAQGPGVEWLDLDNRDRLAAVYAEAWTSVLASTDEAFGLVLLEALAAGTPVVGYADGAIPELIDTPQVGGLFERLEPGVLADALLQTLELACDPGTAARCRARAEQLSVDRCAARYLELYAELLEPSLGSAHSSITCA